MPLLFLGKGGDGKGRKKKSRSEPGPQNAPTPAQPVAQNANIYLQPSPPQPYHTCPSQPWEDGYLQPRPQPYHTQSAPQYSNGGLQLSPPTIQEEQPRPHSKHSYSNLRDQLTGKAGKSVTRLTTKTSQCFDRTTDGFTQTLNQGAAIVDRSTDMIAGKGRQMYDRGAALCDLMSSKLDAVITSMDGERFSGREQDLMMDSFETLPSTLEVPSETSRSASRRASEPSSNSGKRSNNFKKCWMYANSRLPPHLPPFKIYMPTWPLLCLAANYSEQAYTPPKSNSSEKGSHVPSDWRSGTKAMVLKSIPIDDMNTVVFAIRGSATFMDWAVNTQIKPDSPAGFLDDEGNLCHAGFLQVARQMISPVAERLKTLLEENPGRSNCSLLITGHSAGGAVAALLFAHMMSTTVSSELNYLTGFFKRIHCVTFGAPPVSLLPLQRPIDKRHRKSLFYNFINEGDPVPRADPKVMKSLVNLYISPAPQGIYNTTLISLSRLNLSSNNLSKATLQSSPPKPSKPSIPFKTWKASNASTSTVGTLPTWNLPPTTHSLAGRLIVLRDIPGKQGSGDIEAVTVDDGLLRTVVYGDPMMHTMKMYRERVEKLAVGAATAKGY